MQDKAKVQSRRLLQLVTRGTIYQHFVEQQHNALRRGLIRREVPRPVLRSFARDCHASLRQKLQQCDTVLDVRSVTNALIKEIGPRRTGFLRAAWKGSRKATLDSLR